MRIQDLFSTTKLLIYSGKHKCCITATESYQWNKMHSILIQFN